MTESCDVLVIGAGLAGLQCARELQAAGRDVQVWEASDDVGGRIRTDPVDGFLVDRGFQVLNPAYPAVRRWVDADALRLQAFGAGVGVRRADRLAVLAHPVREPGRIVQTLRSGLLGPAGVAALSRWAAPALGRPARRDHTKDLALHASLDRVGLSGELRTVIDKFLAGVLLEDDGSSSHDFALLLLRMFVLGAPGLPTDGMAALPRQLASALTTPVRTHARVEAVEPSAGSILIGAGGSAIRAAQVVVSTDPLTASELAGTPAPAMKGLLTHWFAADRPPGGRSGAGALDLLCVDGRPGSRGPLVNTAVVSVAAPSYAPAGRQLVQASALYGAGRAVPSEDDVRRHAAEILGTDATGWELLARHEVPHALPVQAPPLVLRQPVEASPGIFVCGDHRDTASIQGALVSGHRAARAVLDAGPGR